MSSKEKDKEEGKEEDALAVAVAKLDRRFGRGIVVRGASKAAIVISRLPTGSLGLDLGLHGGWLRGHVNVVWGGEGTGKNYLAARAMALAQQAGLQVAFINVEASLDPAWYSLCGVRTEEMVIVPSIRLMEEAYETAAGLVSSGGVGMLVLDSLVGLSPLAEQEKGLVDDGFSTLPRKVGELVRRLQSALQPRRTREGLVPNETCVLLTNQARTDVGSKGGFDLMPGGRGLAHGNHNLVHLRRVMDLRRAVTVWYRNKDGELERDQRTEAVGQIMRWEVEHAKFQPRGCWGTFSMLFRDVGGRKRGVIDRADEILRYALMHGTVTNEPGSSWYQVGDARANGRAALEQHVRALPPEELDRMACEVVSTVKKQEGWST